VRQQFIGPSRRRGIPPQGATYIEPFCGPGRARIRKTDRLIDGNAIAAATMAPSSRRGFLLVTISEAKRSFKRLESVLGSSSRCWTGSGTTWAGVSPAA
jgi:hypothetical protein